MYVWYLEAIYLKLKARKITAHLGNSCAPGFHASEQNIDFLTSYGNATFLVKTSMPGTCSIVKGVSELIGFKVYVII